MCSQKLDMSQPNAVHAFIHYFFDIILPQHLGFANGLFSVNVFVGLFVCFIRSAPVPDVIDFVIFGDENKL